MTIDSINKTPSRPFWGLKLHLDAYKSLSSHINSVMLRSLTFITGSKSESFGGILREITIIDYIYISSLRVINKTASLNSKEILYTDKELRTYSQKRKRKEIKQFKLILGPNSIYSEFCRESAQLVLEVMPKVAGEALAYLPSSLEMYGLYKGGFIARYLNWKAIQNTDYRNRFLGSNTGRNLSHLFCGLRYSFANAILSKDNVSPLINFEHLFLQLCTKITPNKDGSQTEFPLSNIIIKSLGQSLSHLQKADAFVASCHCKSDEDALIARLEWYRQNNVLPKGLPDPRLVSLNVSNLKDELDKSQNDYLTDISGLILDRLCPKKFSNRILNFFYHLEGKDILKNVLTLLISEFGVKQVADPHLFTLAILFAKGIEVSDYELEGFGRNKSDTILRAGREMMQESLKDNTTWDAIVKIFEQTGLKSSPESFEGILQKNEAKEQLRLMISNAIYEAIKEPSFRHSGPIKTARERVSDLPILGMATTSLHVICNGLWFSLGYLIRDESQQQISFGSWMIKHLSGRKGANRVADKIVDLIYHPGWRFIVLNFIESISDQLQNRVGKSHSEVEETPTEHMHTTVHFLLNHFTKDIGIPMDGILNYFTSEERLKEIQSFLKTTGKPMQETIMESLLPTIKEALLVIRITDLFRQHSIQFSGDDQFWKFFVREYLNRLVLNQIQTRTLNIKLVPVAEYTVIRERILTDILKLEHRELRKFFSPLPEKAPIQPTPPLPRHKIINEYNGIGGYAATSSEALPSPPPSLEIAPQPNESISTPTTPPKCSTRLFVIEDYNPGK